MKLPFPHTQRCKYHTRVKMKETRDAESKWKATSHVKSPCVVPLSPQVFEIFLCHADQCGKNAPQGWSTAKLDATQCVPRLLHGMLPWYVWDPGSSPCHLIWSRSWPSQSKRSHGLAAEEVNHILRRHDGLAALLPGITQDTLLILPPSYDLEQLCLPTCPHSTWPLLQFHFVGSDCYQVYPKGTPLPK